MSLTGTLRSQITAEFTSSGIGNATANVLEPSNYWDWTVANGTGANQADLVYRAQRTLSGSSSENLDLAGSLTDPFGTTLTFARVKFIFVKAASANGGNIIVGGAAANTFVGPFADATDKVQIPAGGHFQVGDAGATGWVVTAGTGDILKVENSDASSATYDIVIIGASA